jgi:hypothetical protein
VTLSNASAPFGQSNYVAMSRRIHAAVPENDWLPVSLQENRQTKRVSVQVLCRTKDVPRVTKALEGY